MNDDWNEYLCIIKIPCGKCDALVSTILPSESNLYQEATLSCFVLVVTATFATQQRAANASPRKPYVDKLPRRLAYNYYSMIIYNNGIIIIRLFIKINESYQYYDNIF
jgi:hypothetical protein